MIDSRERETIRREPRDGGIQKICDTGFYSDSRVSVDPSKSSWNAVQLSHAGLATVRGCERREGRKRRMSGGKSRVEGDGG